MLGERRAVAAEVQPYDVHGSPHVQVALAFDDGTFEQVRLGAESVPDSIACRRSGGRPTRDERRRGDRTPPRRRASRSVPRAERPRRFRAPGAGRPAIPLASRTTRRTHHASAWLRDLATPASTSVSSTVRSGIRRRVIAGVATVVNRTRWSPHVAPQLTLRPNRRSASSATRMRWALVSSRKPWIRAASAAFFVSGPASAGRSGSSSVPTTRISSLSNCTLGAAVNQSFGSRPANHPTRCSWKSLDSVIH